MLLRALPYFHSQCFLDHSPSPLIHPQKKIIQLAPSKHSSNQPTCLNSFLFSDAYNSFILHRRIKGLWSVALRASQFNSALGIHLRLLPIHLLKTHFRIELSSKFKALLVFLPPLNNL